MECDLHSDGYSPSLVFDIFMFEKFRRENLKTMRQMPSLTFTKVKEQSTEETCSHILQKHTILDILKAAYIYLSEFAFPPLSACNL